MLTDGSFENAWMSRPAARKNAAQSGAARRRARRHGRCRRFGEPQKPGLGVELDDRVARVRRRRIGFRGRPDGVPRIDPRLTGPVPEAHDRRLSGGDSPPSLRRSAMRLVPTERADVVLETDRFMRRRCGGSGEGAHLARRIPPEPARACASRSGPPRCSGRTSIRRDANSDRNAAMRSTPARA